MDSRELFGIYLDHVETRSSGRYSGAEVEMILAATHQIDARKLGCPPALFDQILAANAERRGIRPSQPQPVDDLEIRLASIKPF